MYVALSSEWYIDDWQVIVAALKLELEPKASEVTVPVGDVSQIKTTIIFAVVVEILRYGGLSKTVRGDSEYCEDVDRNCDKVELRRHKAVNLSENVVSNNECNGFWDH